MPKAHQEIDGCLAARHPRLLFTMIYIDRIFIYRYENLDKVEARMAREDTELQLKELILCLCLQPNNFTLLYSMQFA